MIVIVNSFINFLKINNSYLFKSTTFKKVVINIRLNNYLNDKKRLNIIIKFVNYLTLQQPLLISCKKKSFDFINNNKNISSIKVTLFKFKMLEFLGKVVNFYFNRKKFIKSLSINSFNSKNTITIGIDNCLIFSDIFFSLNDDFIFGMDITIILVSFSLYNSYKLLKIVGFNFK